MLHLREQLVALSSTERNREREREREKEGERSGREKKDWRIASVQRRRRLCDHLLVAKEKKEKKKGEKMRGKRKLECDEPFSKKICVYIFNFHSMFVPRRPVHVCRLLRLIVHVSTRAKCVSSNYFVVYLSLSLSLSRCYFNYRNLTY